MSFFKLGKARLPHRKSTAAMPPVAMEPPKTVTIPMSQHIGAPATPVCAVGDTVFVGTLIGEAAGFVSAPVHSSVSGTVKKIDTQLMANGKSGTVIVIESDGLMTPDPGIKPPVIESFADLSAAARAAGLVGLGGAGFPTSVKLDPKKLDALSTLVLNGAECEPYITSDTRTMLDRAEDIRYGVELILRHSNIKDVYIGVEKNKAECISHLNGVFADMPAVKVATLPDAYPQGAEKILIYNTIGRVVPEGGLPSDVGVLVMNVTTVAALAEYVKTGMPVVKKCVTVDGSVVNEPKNVIVPVGTSVGDVIEAAGGLSDEAGKIILGGPMMGVAIYSLDHPVMKNCNAIVVFNKKEAKKQYEYPCIHCGRCVAICPMGLNPTVYAKALNVADAEDRIQRYTDAKLNLCIECGSCSYACPSNRPLVENNRLAKAELREYTLAHKVDKK
jgi:electron transport complex protein RnfC